MFGIDVQELLQDLLVIGAMSISVQQLLVIGAILVLFVFVNPPIFYTILLLGLKVLKSPRRVLIALWVLGIVSSVAKSHGDATAAFMTAILATLLTIAIQFGWLWLMGCLWQRIGLSRPGSAFRNMALLHFRALRPTEEGLDKSYQEAKNEGGVKSWFSKIETAEQAEKAIKEVTIALYCLAVLDFLFLVLFLGKPVFLTDVFLLLALGFLFKRTHSRCIALVIAGYAIVTGALTVLGRLGLFKGSGGTNIVLAAIVAIAAFRGVQASFIYHRQHETRANVRGVVILSVIATFLSAVAFVVVIVAALIAGYDLQNDADSARVGGWLIPSLILPWFLVFGRVLPFIRRLRVVKPAQA